ncbi:MAG: hypothetical protein KDK05_16890 [Candidatus Competibacteraceae bacterium]|nr:hypothetical protein [Candidatus Competibacteraceae bacterium]
MISKSELFKSAHRITRRTIQAGDDYRATFALCLKEAYRVWRERANMAKLPAAGFNEWRGQRLYWNSEKYSCTVYLDLETQKWVAKGYQSRAAKAEAIRIYTQTMGA